MPETLLNGVAAERSVTRTFSYVSHKILTHFRLRCDTSIVGVGGTWLQIRFYFITLTGFLSLTRRLLVRKTNCILAHQVVTLQYSEIN